MFKISVVLMPETHLEGLSFYHASLSLTAHQFLATLFATNYQSTCLSLCNNNLPYRVYIPINWEIHILSYLAYNKAYDNLVSDVIRNFALDSLLGMAKKTLRTRLSPSATD